MKKLLVATALVLFAVICAQAQSPRVEVLMTDTTFQNIVGKTSKVKNKKSKRDSVNVNLIKLAVERQVKQQVIREAQKKQQETNKSAKLNPDQIRKQWLKAIFLGGKFPGESDEAYKKRLEIKSYPATQPYK